MSEQGMPSPNPPSTPPAHAPIRLVALDLDGTLLNDAKEVSQRTLEALAGLSQRGVKVVIATARPPRSVRHIYQQLRLDTLQINYNGALIWDPLAKTAFFHRPIPADVVRNIIASAREAYSDVQVTCEVLDRWYTDFFDPRYITETGRLFRPDVIAPIDKFLTEPITKLLLLSNPLILDALVPALGQAYEREVSLVRTEPNLIQIMERQVSKARALMMVARFYEVPMNQVMAIGDAPNDVGMLQSSGVAIAVDNAHPRVKEVAHWVAPSNNDHGVQAALERYGLV